MKYKFFVLLGFYGAGLLRGLAPAAGAREENILTLPSSVRSQGMGNAYSAVGQDITALFNNPAGLGFARHYEGTFLYQKGFQDMRQHNLGLTIPFGGFAAANVDRLGTFGVSFGLLDYGHFETRDRSGSRIGTYEADENLFTLAYGQRFMEWASIGVKGKMYKRTIEQQKASGWAYDVGGLIGKKEWPVRVAVTGFNLGGKSTFTSVDEDLPQSVVYGAAYVAGKEERFTLSADADQPKQGKVQYRFGSEFWINSIYALRAGYDSRIKSGVGASVGFGIRLEEFEAHFFPVEQILIDYAFTPGDQLANAHQLSFSFRLGIP